MSTHPTRRQAAGLYALVAAAGTRFRRLAKFLRRRARSSEDIEDLIQEAMLRVHGYGRTSHTVDEEALLRPTGTNLCLDRHRRDHSDTLKEVAVEELDASASLISMQATPEGVLCNEQRLKTVQAALDTVSPLTREVFLAHRAGYSYPDLAHHFNISHSEIQRHVARALLALMEHLDGAALPLQQ
jgi:RNA polymerase sigma factor (sigma-70 family)